MERRRGGRIVKGEGKGKRERREKLEVGKEGEKRKVEEDKEGEEEKREKEARRNKETCEER